MTGFQRSEVVIVSFTATEIKLFASAISRIKKVPLITNEEKLMNAKQYIHEGCSHIKTRVGSRFMSSSQINTRAPFSIDIHFAKN